MKIDEVGRGVDMHALTQRLGDGSDEGDQRSLAIGAGDMDHWGQLALWMPEACEQALDAPKRQVDGLRVQRLEALEQRHASRDRGQWRAALVAVGQIGQWDCLRRYAVGVDRERGRRARSNY